MNDQPSVLFVCVHNAGRSQMAAAYLTHLAGDRVQVRSAGSAPADAVNPAVVHQGVFFGGGVELLQDQVIAVVVVLAFSFVATLIIGTAIDMTMGLRVDEAAEDVGLDISQHAETAYAS